MVTFATTRLSSKGQVVIPEEIRDRMGLKVGCQFLIVSDGDGVFLKIIHPPSRAEFGELMASARRSARAAGLRKSDITAAIKRVRARARRDKA